ncbi:hypothetical protein [Hymenobacter sp. UYCo722]|uniref:hypothetical protein n=1 Tax=Hymenobacter sp. UYCo722 TaxID=3156335 RepID=UPI003393B599
MDLTFPQANLPQPASGSGPLSRLSNLPPHRYLDREIAPLILGQNAPNPHQGETYVPFTLLYPADVRLEIYDLLGRKMAAVVRKGLSSGEHRIQLNLRGLHLPLGDYPYQLLASSGYGQHCLSRVMTLTLEDAE